MTEEQIPKESNVASTLSFRNLYNHFFLVHDFLHRITKVKATNSNYFDLQIDIYNGMRNSVNTGSKITQGLAFGGLCWYFLRGKSLGLRFVYGFLFMYWYNHIITLGSYAGVFARMPSLYNQTAAYYNAHPQEKNLVEGLQRFMQKADLYQQPQLVISQLFGIQNEEKSYVANDFFVKNKDKYLPKEAIESHIHNEKKLKYADSFLTRYVYYSFQRWWVRLMQFLSFEEEP